jgi:protein-disulfide isomerase
MTKKYRHNPTKGELKRKRLLIAAMTMAALLVFILVVFLGAQSRKSGGEIEVDLAEIETGITEDGLPYQGAPNAPVKLIEYSDYLCGHCRSFTLEKEPRLVKDYVATGKVQYIYQYYTIGEAQVLLDEASHCAADQGHFWEYHRLMFENQSRFTTISSLEELQSLLIEFAEQGGLDVPDFETCWSSHRHQETIIESIQAARALGVGGTPAFSIQGELIVGNQPYAVFQQAIETALEVAQ